MHGWGRGEEAIEGQVCVLQNKGDCIYLFTCLCVWVFSKWLEFLMPVAKSTFTLVTVTKTVLLFL